MISGPAIRPRLPLLSRILIAYGAIGLGVALVAMVVLLAGLGRVDSLRDRLRDDVGGVSAVLETTADVLDGAAGSADGIDRTISSTTTALSTAAADLRGIEPLLRDIETRANAINILGSQPLAPLAGQFGAIAGQLGDLDGQLDGIAANLQGNQGALSANAASLTKLAIRTRDLAARLGGDELPSVLADARWLLIAMLLVGALGAAVPAAGALLLGLWLRRILGASRPGA